MPQTQDFLYGLDEFKFSVTGSPVAIGAIAQGSFDLGGQAGEATEIWSAQSKSAPVLVIPKKNGTIKPSFDLIELKYDKLALLMGGAVTLDDDGVAIGWDAPSQLVQVTGHAQIFTDSGHLIDIPVCTVTAYLTDKLHTDGTAKIHCELSPIQSAAGVVPFSVKNAPVTN
jgi:hypothetical protein